jgi:hypothetical protein
MSNDEIDELMQSRRQARREFIERNRNKRNTKKKKKSKKKDTSKKDILASLKGFTDEQKQKLLDELT